MSPDLLGKVTANGSQRETRVVLWRDGKIVTTIENALGTPNDLNSAGVAVGGHFDEWGDTRVLRTMVETPAFR